MICCNKCFEDPEIQASIISLGHKGNFPSCKSDDVYLYDFENNSNSIGLEEHLNSILEIYCPNTLLPDNYPENEKKAIEDRVLHDWNIFKNDIKIVKKIIKIIVEKSFNLDDRILIEKVGIPELFDEEYLSKNSCMGKYNWEEFKKNLRNGNRFHNHYANLEVLREILKDAEITIYADEKYYRSRVANEKGKVGFKRKEMGAPPDDVASAGRANSKGQSCLYLSNKKETTVKEIRAHAFDYVTIATFKLIKDIKVLDLTSITHNSPFYNDGDKIVYLINEKILKLIEKDLAKPLSRYDSELDYLPTQYISDFAKFLGYDGVKYYSTFDKDSYNLALFNSDVCKCVYRKNYLIGHLDYELELI